MVNLLIVEDNINDLNLCIEMLQSVREGINIITAQTAEDALNILTERTIDGALIDIELPGIDGLSLVKRIQKIEDYQFLPILFVSGTDNDYAETYKQYHNYNFISKPYTKKNFLVIFSSFLNVIKKQKKIFRTNDEKEIFFRGENSFVRIKFSDLLFATNDGRKIKLVTRQNEYLRTNLTLRNLITEINDERFVLCSQSAAVNIINIEKIFPTSYAYKSWTISFIDAPDKTCPLSFKNKRTIEILLENKTRIKGVENDAALDTDYYSKLS